MSRFYFNFRQGGTFTSDDTGCEFANVEEAYLAAVRAAQDIWHELLIERENPLECAFEVLDAKGRDLFTLPFSEILEACIGQPPGKLPHQSVTSETALAKAQQRISDVSKTLTQARAKLLDARALLSQTRRARES